jgi:hypothetical protein
MENTNRLTAISFFGTVAASSKKTLVSKRITSPFRIKKIRASFAPGVNRLMNLYFFISFDDSAPTTEEPKGVNLLSQTGQVLYITGDDQLKEMELEIYQKEKGAFVKVYADNTDTYEHTIDCQIVIEMLEEEAPAAPAA